MALRANAARMMRRVLRRPQPDELKQAVQGPRLYAYLDPQTAMTSLHDGQLIFVDPLDEQLTPSIVAYGMWERWIEVVVRRLLRPGHRVIDVGANVGYYTLVMSSLIGPTGRLDAFEASPRMARLLRRTVGASGRGEFVTVHEVIVADRPGTMHLNFTERYGGAGNVAENGWTFGDDTQTVEREAVRLDDLFSDEVVDFIRIDTEGSEVLILQGALELLARSPSVKLCVEWYVNMMAARGDVARLVAQLEGLGFRFWRIDPQGLVPLTPAEALQQPPCDVLIARTLD